MQKAPSNSFPEREPPSVPRPPHGLLLAQMSLAIVAVFVGISEVNPWFSWAQWLIPVLAFLGPAMMALPFVITAICVRRRVSSIRTTAALVVSISLLVVAIWGYASVSPVAARRSSLASSLSVQTPSMKMTRTGRVKKYGNPILGESTFQSSLPVKIGNHGYPP